MKRYFVIALAALVLIGCKETGRTLPSATGTIYEILVVADNADLRADIESVMGADMPCLPQIEPYFTVTTVRKSEFDNLLMPTRNILYVDIDSTRYTQAKVVYKTDAYSHPQAYCRLQAPSLGECEELWLREGVNVRNHFVRQEMNRQGEFYKGYRNSETNKTITERFGVQMWMPDEYILIMDTTIECQGAKTKFLWCCNNGGPMRKDVVIYSYPYTDAKTFTRDFLLTKRDSIMGRFVSAKEEGTYMTTEYKEMPPVFTAISVQDNAYCAELRGLWKMQGVAMGGAFVSHTRLDEISQQVITVETFQFAPGQKKRNALRQAEAILYTMKLPQEINAIKEITVQ